MSLLKKLDNSDKMSVGDGDTKYNIDINSLSSFKKKKTIHQKFVKELNERKDVNTYDELWSKGLPASFWDLKLLSDKNFNITDITDVIYRSDYCEIQSWRAIENTKTDISVYIPVCGVWEEQKGNSMMRDLIERYMKVLKKLVIDQIAVLKLKAKEQIECVADTKLDMNKLVEHYKFLDKREEFYTKLYNYLGNRNQDTIIKRLIDKMVKETKDDENFKTENFNRATGYIAFTDGVYSFEKKGLISEKEALPLLITKTTGYDYQKVIEVNDENMVACMTFIQQIIPNQNILKWLLWVYNRHFASIVLKLILILHGQRGNNGKSRLMELINMALGDLLYCKCGNELLNKKSFNNIGGTNEELMSMNGALFIAFQEPNRKSAFDMSVLKELSGGDAITGRRLFKGKEKFYIKGLINVCCNDIPPLDGADEASFNRIMCVPFNSIFTSNPNLIDTENHIYPADTTINEKFEMWKYAFMKIVLKSDEPIDTPDEVLAHTNQYRERENVIWHFVKDCVEEVLNDDGTIDKKRYILRKDLLSRYKYWLKEEGYEIKVDKNEFDKNIKEILNNYREDTTINNKRFKAKLFLGYRMINDCVISCEDDYD